MELTADQIIKYIADAAPIIASICLMLLVIIDDINNYKRKYKEIGGCEMNYNPGDKFIIEIDSVYSVDDAHINLYRIKGFNALVFDKAGLDKLEKVSDKEPQTFEVGDEVWFSDSAEYAYVLIPNYSDDEMVVSMEGEICPQIKGKRDAEKTGCNQSWIKKNFTK